MICILLVKQKNTEGFKAGNWHAITELVFTLKHLIIGCRHDVPLPLKYFHNTRTLSYITTVHNQSTTM